MTAAPPAYSTDAPPSYEEVVRKFEGLIGNNPTATGVFEAAANGLTKEDLDVLIANHENPLNSEREKADFSRGVAETSSASELQSSLVISAKAAAATAGSVRGKFDGLQTKIERIDLRWGTEWAGDFNGMQRSFQTVINESQDVATRTYTFARKFDNQDILYCDDSSKPMADRKTRIQSVITAAEDLKQKNTDITSRLTTVGSNLSTFTDEFITWAKDKEGELSRELEKIKRELVDLRGTLAQLETAAEAVNHAAQGLLPIMEGLAAIYPPYGTLIALGGLLIAGVQLATTTALMVRISSVKQEIVEKTAKQGQLEADLEQVREAREGVEGMVSANLSSFRGTISSMTSTPTASITDAKQILQWLENGAPEDERPPYMSFNIKNSAKSYSSMGGYLREYGRGIQPFCTVQTPIPE
ncbi:uncharacterized protein BDW43DRAFT_287345 [Aspergillus alliaceus]|uniref:uncharacterized protein n=1 Tax=Petromyces alliaceus TaxID=209559 RepID=UPI0012A59E1C|nr:uncharacterized protein BDW43DRAFT_287345 [Aspergillus alliaceus]KAB8229931.1 hypothetical protein BDW43DRAFT_287345 [Aspergillus alliaceus]